MADLAPQLIVPSITIVEALENPIYAQLLLNAISKYGKNNQFVPGVKFKSGITKAQFDFVVDNYNLHRFIYASNNKYVIFYYEYIGGYWLQDRAKFYDEFAGPYSSLIKAGRRLTPLLGIESFADALLEVGLLKLKYGIGTAIGMAKFYTTHRLEIQYFMGLGARITKLMIRLCYKNTQSWDPRDWERSDKTFVLGETIYMIFMSWLNAVIFLDDPKPGEAKRDWERNKSNLLSIAKLYWAYSTRKLNGSSFMRALSDLSILKEIAGYIYTNGIKYSPPSSMEYKKMVKLFMLKNFLEKEALERMQKIGTEILQNRTHIISILSAFKQELLELSKDISNTRYPVAKFPNKKKVIEELSRMQKFAEITINVIKISLK